MKFKYLRDFLLIAGLTAACNLTAGDEVPCLRFSGASETGRNIPLHKYNRIYLTDNGFRLTSPTEDEELALLYSLYNHLEFGDEIPSEEIPTGVEGIIKESDFRLVYVDESRSLRLEGASDGVCTVGLFSSDGLLMQRLTLHAGEIHSLESLPTGVYLAVGIDGKSKTTLKFIIK